MHDVANEVGKLVDGVVQLQQRIGSVVIDAFHPRCNRDRGAEEAVGRLFEGVDSKIQLSILMRKNQCSRQAISSLTISSSGDVVINLIDSSKDQTE